jgi:RNA polymerase sigma factor (sigma-70 family)
MGLEREVLVELVPRILSGDDAAFKIFYDEYVQIVKLHAGKWIWSVNRATMNMYDYEDVFNEIWEFVIRRLPYYDASKSSMTTFLYMVCDQAGERIANYYNRQMRNPGEEIASLDMEFGEEKDLKMIDMIIDPVHNTEDEIISEVMIYEYIYFLKDFIKGLNKQQQIVYLHRIKGFTLRESANILCVTYQRIEQICHTIQKKVFKKRASLKRMSYTNSDQFAILLLSTEDDDVISEKSECDLATVKICREILSIAGLYCK